ncbi:MAG TPA: SOS response-associated peptidase family protein [Candidatus Acidoferrum sp.]|nr:SOS response-associated peptidase family protein [Candidatus Acidoferrum sp.]
MSVRLLTRVTLWFRWIAANNGQTWLLFGIRRPCGHDGELFAFAGLWDRSKDPSGQWIKSCSILTTTPNAVTSSVHDRMPVILDRGDYDLWLDPGMTKVEAVADLLKPYDARTMRSYPVSSRVNHVANDDAECSLPIELIPIQTQTTLF